METKKRYSIVCLLTIMLLCIINSVNAQTTVSSLQELLPYLEQNNMDVKLAPGTYDITTDDVSAGLFGNPLLVFRGNDNTFDFTDVTINVDSAISQSFGNVDVNEIQILGNNNILKNLNLVDIGDTRPTRSATSILMDGSDNRIEGFDVFVKGSYPYGYGDAFGKGSSFTIKHYKKCGVLVRGLRNHLKDSNIISRAYGHIVFMQAASFPTIEGCYIEGEMRSTDDMLAEEGTGSAADQIDFMTDWGYRLPAGYYMSLQEEGIRAYNAGTTYINGEVIQRGTDNPTILNCTVKNARGGVTLSHASGTKYVENCETIGCEQGFAIGSGDIVNCRADAQYGAVYGTANSTDNGATVDITILPSNTGDNGSRQLAYIGGINHDLTFKSDEIDPDQSMHLKMSGINYAVRSFESTGSTNNLLSTSIKITNLTEYPIILEPNATGIIGQSCGPVTDNGTSNNIISCDEEFIEPIFPDPNKTYWLGNNRFLAFASANGGDTVFSTPYDPGITGLFSDFPELLPGADSHWKFTPVEGRDGYFFVDCIEGGTKTRLVATTSSGLPVIGENTIADNTAQWSVVQPEGRTTYHITNDYARIVGANTESDQIILSTITDTNHQSRFEIREVPEGFRTTLSIRESQQLENATALYPIPTTDLLHMELRESQAASTKMEILTLTGQLLISKSMEKGKNQINVSNFKPGIYLAKISNSNGGYHTEKVIVD